MSIVDNIIKEQAFSSLERNKKVSDTSNRFHKNEDEGIVNGSLTLTMPKSSENKNDGSISDMKSDVKIIKESFTTEKVESKAASILKQTNQDTSVKMSTTSDIPDGPITKSIYLTELEDSPVPEDPDYYENIEVSDEQKTIDSSKTEKRKSKEVVEGVTVTKSIIKSTDSMTETKKISDLNSKQIVPSKSSTKVNLEEVYDEANVALKSVTEVKEIIKPKADTIIPIIKEHSEKKLSHDTKNVNDSVDINFIPKGENINAGEATSKPNAAVTTNTENEKPIIQEEVKATDIKNKTESNKFDLNGEMVRVVMVNKEIKPLVEPNKNSPEDVVKKAEESLNSKSSNRENLTYSEINFSDKTASNSKITPHLPDKKTIKEIHSFKAVKVSQVTVNNPVTQNIDSSLKETSVQISSIDDSNVKNDNDQPEVTYKEIRKSNHMLNREVKTTIQSTTVSKPLNDDINPKQITDKETLMKFLETNKSQESLEGKQDEITKTISEGAKTDSVKDLDESVSEGSDTLKTKKESKGKTIFNILSKSLSKSSISAKENNTSQSSIKANNEIPEVKSSTSANMDIPEKIPESKSQLVIQKNVDKNTILSQKENNLIGEKLKIKDDLIEASDVETENFISNKNENQFVKSISLELHDKSKVEDGTPMHKDKQNNTNPSNVSEIKPLENFVIKRNSTVSDIKQAINRNSLIMDDLNLDINKVATIEAKEKNKDDEKIKILIVEDKNNIENPCPIVVDNLQNKQDIEYRKSREIEEKHVPSESKQSVSLVKKSRSSALLDKFFKSDKQDKHEEKRNSLASDDGKNADNLTNNIDPNVHTEKRNSTIERTNRDA